MQKNDIPLVLPSFLLLISTCIYFTYRGKLPFSRFQKFKLDFSTSSAALKSKNFYFGYTQSKSRSLFFITPVLLRKSFTHSGAFHLFFNLFILNSLYQLTNKSEDQQFLKLIQPAKLDNFKLNLIILGCLFSMGFTKLTMPKHLQNRLLMGISGGVYTYFGFHYDLSQDFPIQLTFILDVNGDYPIGLADFKKLVLLESLICALQYLKIINWPIAHMGHISGYVFGMLMKEFYGLGSDNVFQEEIELLQEKLGWRDMHKNASYYERQY